MTAPEITKPRFGIVAPRVTAALFVGWMIVELPDLVRDPRRFLSLVLFGLVVTAVVTVHEAGHFAVGTAFGLDLYVRVGPLLGYCAPVGGEDDEEIELTPAQRLAYAAGGPAANLLSWLALTLPPTRALIPVEATSVWGAVLEMARDISLVLGVLNLIPVSLLDGGRIFCALVEMIAPRKGATVIMVFRFASVVICGVLATRAVVDGDGWMSAAILTATYVGLGVGAFAVPAPPQPVESELEPLGVGWENIVTSTPNEVDIRPSRRSPVVKRYGSRPARTSLAVAVPDRADEGSASWPSPVPGMRRTTR